MNSYMNFIYYLNINKMRKENVLKKILIEINNDN